MRLVFGHLKRMESVVQPSQNQSGGHGYMVLAKSENNQDLDMEWVALIMDARTLGLSKEDIRKALLLLKENGKDDMQETAV
ncbi:hypothetical protein ASG81_03555 [Paenibacillus sp. Soil522]|nr:hypothetical protein ASG81_03555 [Paenibacillus sp. Soil522]